MELATSKAGDRLTVLRAFAQTSQEARHDPATGMHNRWSLDEQLRRLGQGRSYAVLCTDLDRFKALNDTYEFVVVLPDASLATAEATAERIRATLASMLEREEVPPFTVSLGVAMRQPGEAFEEPRDRADRALRRARDQGRDRVMSKVRLDGENAVVNVGPSAG